MCKKHRQHCARKHTPCGYSMSTNWASYNTDNKHAFYWREGLYENFCSSLGE